MDKVWRGVTVGEVRLSIELCAVYWHFLLLVWLVFSSLLVLTDPIEIESDSGLVSLVSLCLPCLKMLHRGLRKNK